MKEIKAIVQPNRVGKIRDAFRDLPGFPGMNITRVQGCSQHAGAERHASIREELTDFSDKVRLEIVAPEEIVPDIVRIIRENTFSGQTGDGVLWITDVLEFHRLCKIAG